MMKEKELSVSEEANRILSIRRLILDSGLLRGFAVALDVKNGIKITQRDFYYYLKFVGSLPYEDNVNWNMLSLAENLLKNNPEKRIEELHQQYQKRIDEILRNHNPSKRGTVNVPESVTFYKSIIETERENLAEAKRELQTVKAKNTRLEKKLGTLLEYISQNQINIPLESLWK